MDAQEVTEVCRLCPTSGVNQSLLYVFDKHIPFRYNITEVISITTGIEVLESDLVSKKICQRCCNILLKMFEFRLDALKQDKKLKERCSQLLLDKGIKLPNTCVTIKKEKFELALTKKDPKMEPSSTVKGDLKPRIHSSVADIYKNYPHLKLSKKWFERDMAPVVSLTMGEVETYFRKRKLDMRKFIYRDKIKSKSNSNSSEEKKVVSPLKISKTLLKAHENSEFDSDDTRLKTPKHTKGRKRIISSSDSNKSESSKCSRRMDYKLDSNLTNMFKPTTSTTKDLSVSLLDTNLRSNEECSSTSIFISKKRAPSPTSLNRMSDNSNPPLPTPTDLMSENSKDSFSTNASKTSTSNDYGKPEYIESLGLTPTVTQTKSHKLLICCVCGSFHNNAFELKKHTKKHMVCQFCKLRFKSVEAKLNHVDNQCQVKKIMNSSGPSVALEKIHLNLNVRKKYKNAFTSFELIPGLVEPSPLEHIDLKPTSPLSLLDADDIIVLSDEDDDTSTRSIDPLSGISTPLANMPSPAVENIVYSTVSIVRPDIRIKNNTVLNYMMENMTDGDLVKHLIETFNPEKTYTDKMMQTDLPANEDIQINSLENTCEFKKLKTQLLTYKIPVYLSNGSFHASYKCKDNKGTLKSLALWNDLPVIDVCNRTDTARSSNNTIIPLTADSTSLPGPSQPKASTVAISPLPVITHVTSASVPIITNVSIVPIMSLSPATTFTTSASTNNTVLQNPLLTNILDRSNSLPQNVSTPLSPIIGSNSATPLLQNYALSITPQITHNPIPIPRTYINSALNYTASVSNRTMSLANNTTFSSKPFPSSFSQSHLATITPVTTVIVNNPGTLMGNLINTQIPQNGNKTSHNMSLLKPRTSGTAVQPTNILPASVTETNPGSSSSAPKPSGFRVKSVWELQ